VKRPALFQKEKIIRRSKRPSVKGLRVIRHPES
jgi:hypothetical protein